MGERSRLIALAAGLLSLFTAVLPAVGVEGDRVERYLFKSLPAGSSEAAGESVAMTVSREDHGYRYRARSTSPAGPEEVEIVTDLSGRLISAVRQRPLKSRGQGAEKIWGDGERMYLETGPETERIIRTFDIPRGKSIAVDGSLLLLLRSFPFDRDVTWPLFMVDFSGASVTVELRQTAVESIAVGAGTFECYRMEAVVEIPLLRPRIIYWVTKKTPHFLVKSLGKRGPFTDSYETTLVSVEGP